MPAVAPFLRNSLESDDDGDVRDGARRPQSLDSVKQLQSFRNYVLHIRATAANEGPVRRPSVRAEIGRIGQADSMMPSTSNSVRERISSSSNFLGVLPSTPNSSDDENLPSNATSTSTFDKYTAPSVKEHQEMSSASACRIDRPSMSTYYRDMPSTSTGQRHSLARFFGVMPASISSDEDDVFTTTSTFNFEKRIPPSCPERVSSVSTFQEEMRTYNSSDEDEYMVTIVSPIASLRNKRCNQANNMPSTSGYQEKASTSTSTATSTSTSFYGKYSICPVNEHRDEHDGPSTSTGRKESSSISSYAEMPSTSAFEEEKASTCSEERDLPSTSTEKKSQGTHHPMYATLEQLILIEAPAQKFTPGSGEPRDDDAAKEGCASTVSLNTTEAE